MSGEIRSSLRKSAVSLYLRIKKQYYMTRTEKAELLAFTSYTKTIRNKKGNSLLQQENT